MADSKWFSDSLRAQPAPPPGPVGIGSQFDWASAVEETLLYVELPFRLMMPEGNYTVSYLGAQIEVTVLGRWREVFMDRFTESRSSLTHQGPDNGRRWKPKGEVARMIRRRRYPVMQRSTRTMLRVRAWAHADAFPTATSSDRGNQTYWASLCAANIPVINSLIQQYRLATYDFFAYEVSEWDVPIWYLKHRNLGYTSVVMLYRGWDDKPVLISERNSGGESALGADEFEWVTAEELIANGSDPSPGEFDLMDARNLMERGDYSGAVRRTTTAIETILAAELEKELTAKYGAADAATRMDASKNDFAGRLRQWIKITGVAISQSSIDNLEKTRQVRHGIVHRGERLNSSDSGEAQRMVDTGRWFYNRLERRPDRMAIREGNLGLKSAGRVAMSFKFPASVRSGRLVLGPLK